VPERDSTFVFIPSELAEDVDLPLDVKKDILYLYAHLGTWTHWQVLGVAWNASPAEVRAAYVEKVRRYHPDRYAGRRIGAYLGRIERIFRALTLARDELVDEGRRAAYARKTAPPASVTKRELDPVQEEARAKERRARLARANPMMGRVARIHELLARGRAAAEEGKWAQASVDFLMVASLDPNHAEARELAENARRRAASDKGQALYEAAQAAEAVGNHARAIAILREASGSDPASPRYAIAAARIAIEAGDADAARSLAEDAVRRAPRDPRALEALGMALHAQGDPREARRALDQALAIDPELASAKALLKKLRWSFLR
jgi:tetratricopeptide (TPR) repeat protein